SAKTTTARAARELIDPHRSPLVRARDYSDLVQALSHHYLPIFDNLSSLPEWMSDLFARSVTGEGFSKRRLYTDEDDVIFSFRRVLMLTSINLVITKPDLLDRSLIINLPEIPEEEREEETTFWARFEAARARLFGAIL